METNTKSFFEKYQTFIALIIVGVLVGGGIVVAKLIPQKTSGGDIAGVAQTEEAVRAEMLKAAQDVGVNKKKFLACLDNSDKESVVDDAIALAQQSGVNGTPTFFIIKGDKQFMLLGARDEATILKSIAEGKPPVDQPAQPAGEPIVLTDTDHWFGPRDAEVVIVEYSDIDCPFCKRAKPTIDKILKDHPEFAFVYRHSPIASLHPFAAYRAEATECVNAIEGEKKFWEFLDIVSE